MEEGSKIEKLSFSGDSFKLIGFNNLNREILPEN
jgi:hypothetical protein